MMVITLLRREALESNHRASERRFTRNPCYAHSDTQEPRIYCDVCGHYYDPDDPCPYH